MKTPNLSPIRRTARRLLAVLTSLAIGLASATLSIQASAQASSGGDRIDARQAAQIAERTYSGKVLNVRTHGDGSYTVKILQSDGRIRLVKVSSQGRVRGR